MASEKDADRKYEHHYSLQFRVGGSNDSEGEDVTPEQIYGALLAHVKALMEKGTLADEVGYPFYSGTDLDSASQSN